MNSDPANPRRTMFGVVYGPSKTALNAITLAFALELESTRHQGQRRVPGLHRDGPQQLRRARGPSNRPRVEPVRLALLRRGYGPTGTYSDENGPLPW